MKIIIFIIISSLFRATSSDEFSPDSLLENCPDSECLDNGFKFNTPRKNEVSITKYQELKGKTIRNSYILQAKFKIKSTQVDACLFAIEKKGRVEAHRPLALCYQKSPRGARFVLHSNYMLKEKVTWTHKGFLDSTVWTDLILYVKPPDNGTLMINCKPQQMLQSFTYLNDSTNQIDLTDDLVLSVGFPEYESSGQAFEGNIKELNLYTPANEITFLSFCSGNINDSFLDPLLLKGENGDKGDMGDKGDRGDKGDTGDKGDKGDRGDKGERGERGDEGKAGIQGAIGQPGPPGTAGKDGQKGTCNCSADVVSGLLKSMPEMKGPPGERGWNGTKGEEGPQGIPGEKGLPGLKGEPGPMGLQGPKSPPGPTGNLGPAGSPGERGLPGQNGTTGPIGPEGPQGPPGPKEKGDKGDTGAPGKEGQRGDPGPAGKPGIQGPMGPEGKKGDEGKKGERGERGEAGRHGQHGKHGINGTDGVNGMDGKKGDKGEPAELSSIFDKPNEFVLNELIRLSKGEKGEQGPSGEVPAHRIPMIRGPKGDQGDPGQPGGKGEMGPIGPKGDKGEPGLSGLDGRAGPPGRKGAVGQKGEKGDSPTPINLASVKGPRGYRGYPGSPGPIGPQGQPGPVGPVGPPGIRGLSYMGQKGEPGVTRYSTHCSNCGDLIDDDGCHTANTMIYRTNTALLKNSPRIAEGTLVYIIQDRLLVIKVDNGWEKLETSLVDLTQVNSRQTTPTSTTPIPNTSSTTPSVPTTPSTTTPKPTTLSTTTLAPTTPSTTTPVPTTPSTTTPKPTASSTTTPAPTTPSTTTPKPTTPSTTTLAATTPSTTTLLPTTRTTSTPKPATNKTPPGFPNQPPPPPTYHGIGIRIAALNTPQTGRVYFDGTRGWSAADKMCHRQSKQFKLRDGTRQNGTDETGTFKAFLASRDEFLDAIVRKNDSMYPVVNLQNQILFSSWESMFDGRGAVFNETPNIFTFDGKNVMTEDAWPNKMVWHGGNSTGMPILRNNCNGWRTNRRAITGMASSNLKSSNTKRLLDLKRVLCDTKLIVLCVENTAINLNEDHFTSGQSYIDNIDQYLNDYKFIPRPSHDDDSVQSFYDYNAIPPPSHEANRVQSFNDYNAIPGPSHEDNRHPYSNDYRPQRHVENIDQNVDSTIRRHSHVKNRPAHSKGVNSMKRHRHSIARERERERNRLNYINNNRT